MIKQIVTLSGILITSISAQFTGCDYFQNVVVGQSYDVFSEGYQQFYPPGKNCRWRAMGPANSRLTLNCLDVVLPQNNCNDRLEVSSNPSNPSWYCGSQPFTYTTTGNSIEIALRTQRVGLPCGRFRCQLTAQQSTTVPSECDCGRRKVSRIVNGQATGVNEFTMMAGLVEGRNPSVFCGGTIISNYYVLSSAHCLVSKVETQLSVLVGDHDYLSPYDTPYAAIYQVSRITIHYAYSTATYVNDIGMLTTATSISFNVAVGPACLPFAYRGITFDDQTVEAVGWGTTSLGGAVSTTLQKVALNVISGSECNLYFGNVANTQICVRGIGKDTCQRDSGGPIYGTIYGRVYLLGIISYGQGCGNNYPSVNTRVTSYLDWIKENTYGTVYCLN